MSTTYSIQPVKEADLALLEDFLVSSKLQLSINRFLFKDWPNEPTQRPVYRAALAGGFADPNSKTLKAVDDATGEIVGHLVVTRRTPKAANAEPEPKTEPPAEDGAEAKDNPPSADSSPFVLETLAEVIRMAGEVDVPVKDLDHLQITHIYVRPSSRRKGIGSQLVRFAFEQAKAAGISLAVASEPQAHEFFLSLGFADVVHGEIDLRQFADPYCGYGEFRLFGMKLTE